MLRHRYQQLLEAGLQVAVTGGVAILTGRALSPLRYYWAVIAAFVVFSGTATRAETGSGRRSPIFSKPPQTAPAPPAPARPTSTD